MTLAYVGGGGGWNWVGSCDALVSLSLASYAISTQAAAAWAG